MENPGPATRPTPSNLCGLCLGIFSTLQGLQALVSDLGYKHHRRQELIDQSEAGCELCRLLHQRSVATGAPYPPDEPVWILYAFPDFDLRNSASLMDKPDERATALSSSHPFTVKALENIRALSRHSVLWIQTVTEDGTWTASIRMPHGVSAVINIQAKPGRNRGSCSIFCGRTPESYKGGQHRSPPTHPILD